MKVVLVICLLTFMSCQNDITDIAKCLYESPKVKELISDVMIAIVTKDFSKLLEKIKDSLPELIQVVVKCVAEQGNGEVNLSMKHQECTDCKKNHNCGKNEDCIYKYCNNVC